MEAKKLLWDICSNELPPFIEIKNTDRRTSSEANVCDIFDGISKPDDNDNENFGARKVDKLPEREP